MRTDTTTFRKRVFADLRKAGLSSAKARAARNAICWAAYTAGHPVLSDAARARVSIDSAYAQSVYIDDEGIARFVGNVHESMQPLICTSATEEQEQLRREMEEMLSPMYDAIDTARCDGHVEPSKAPAAAAIISLYNAKRDAVLAINPHVHASVADPDIYESYHNVYKSEYGFRPRGFITLDGVREAMARFARQSLEQAAMAA